MYNLTFLTTNKINVKNKYNEIFSKNLNLKNRKERIFIVYY